MTNLTGFGLTTGRTLRGSIELSNWRILVLRNKAIDGRPMLGGPARVASLSSLNAIAATKNLLERLVDLSPRNSHIRIPIPDRWHALAECRGPYRSFEVQP